MNARFTSTVLLALGIVDLAVLNLMLVPRLQGVAYAAAPPAAVVVEPAPAALGERAAAPAVAAPRLAEPPAVALAAVAPADAHYASAGVWAEPGGAAPAQGDKPSERAMGDVVFGFDSTSPRGLAAVHELRRLAVQLQQDHGRRLVLRGHADPLGVPEHNLTLSRRRAQAIKDYLVYRGAPADRVVVEACGADEPADPRPIPAAWAKDRRVEVLWR